MPNVRAYAAIDFHRDIAFLGDEVMTAADSARHPDIPLTVGLRLTGG
jgi:hypothetical protein